jgi:hypothetical protein
VDKIQSLPESEQQEVIQLLRQVNQNMDDIKPDLQKG